MSDLNITPGVFVPRPTVKAAGMRVRSSVLDAQHKNTTLKDILPRDPRHVRDTVSLGAGGHKVVNLARGEELAREIRARSSDDTTGFLKALKDAIADIQRIGRLFGETVKAAFRAR